LLEGRSKQGFTLLELLIVLVIIAVLAMLTLPSLLGFNQEHKTEYTAQNLYYALQYARSEAVLQNTTIYVNFQTGLSWCYGMNATSNCNCSVANSCAMQVASAPASQMTVLSATGLTNNSLTFEPTHGASGAKSILTFTATGSTPAMSVEVPIMGSVVLCSTTISGYSACP
jgi:type IV fimbrial biogenesis protein FimT